MTSASTPAFIVLVVDDETEVQQGLVKDLHTFWGAALEVEAFASARALLDRAAALAETDVIVPLILAAQEMEGLTGVELLLRLHEVPAFTHSRKVLLSSRTVMDELNEALNRGALNGHIRKPWKKEELWRTLRFLLTEFFIEHHPDAISRIEHLVDVKQVSSALAHAGEELEEMKEGLITLQRSFLTERKLSDYDVEQAMIKELDRVLKNPERKEFPAGSLLLREGQAVDRIFIRLQGTVRLYRKVGDEEMVFHSQTAGRIIGLLALSYGQNAFYTCKAETNVTAIALSIDELDRALQASPGLSVDFITVLLRSLARRNRRAVELQMDINQLNLALARDRDHLREALQQLKKAQMRLVQSEKMATLGELVAGVAHELNNPVAAISRASDFLMKDLRWLAANHPDGETLLRFIRTVRENKPLSSREQRQFKRQLGLDIDDPVLAARLVKVGITSTETYLELFGDIPAARRDRRLDEIETYHKLSTSLRNVESCSKRITALVSSLRSYARAGKELTFDVDIHQGFEETLDLFGHSMKDVELDRDYGDLPRIACRPGELNQVWTNLISNALQAMDRKGSLQIVTRSAGTMIRIDVIDSGPGISPENLDHIFDVNFTTKQGRVDFGLGLGLPICREIIEGHGGDMTVDSEPGRTCFTIYLPVRQESVSDQAASDAASEPEPEKNHG